MQDHPRRILVTGGAGFIGSHIVDALVAAGHRVIALDDLSAGDPANIPGVELIRHDIVAADTPAIVRDVAPDVIVHAAAQVSVSAAVRAPADDARVNVEGSIRVFEGARDAGVPHVVFVTTGGALYGEATYLPCDEAHPIRPLSPYGLSKWVGERYLALLLPDRRLSVLRLANVFGPRQSAEGEAGVVAIFTSRMLGDRPVEIHGDGGQTRDFVYVADVAAAVVVAVQGGVHVTANVGSGTATSVEELFGTLRDLTGYGREPLRVPAREGDVRDSVLDVRHAATTLGWRPSTSLRDGLARTVDWYRTATAASPA